MLRDEVLGVRVWIVFSIVSVFLIGSCLCLSCVMCLCILISFVVDSLSRWCLWREVIMLCLCWSVLMSGIICFVSFLFLV